MLEDMKELLRQRLVETVLEIDKVCRENRLRYFLTGGTLLGAIRHNGIIPWDDDVDVAMPRDDYEKLRSIANKAFNKSKFEWVTNDLDSNYHYCYAKVYHRETTLIEFKDPFYLGGVFVDVFPIDGLPSNRLLRKLHYTRFYFWRKISIYASFSHFPYSNVLNKRILQKFVRFFATAICSKSYAIKKCDEIAMKYSFDTSDIVANLYGAWGKREITNRAFLAETLKYSFEGHLLNIPIGYDAFLRGLYGDYMQLPPEEKRVSQHSQYYINLTEKLTIEEVLKITNDERE